MDSTKIREWLVAAVIISGALWGIYSSLDSRITANKDSFNTHLGDFHVMQQTLNDHKVDDDKTDKRLDRIERLLGNRNR